MSLLSRTWFMGFVHILFWCEHGCACASSYKLRRGLKSNPNRGSHKPVPVVLKQGFVQAPVSSKSGKDFEILKRMDVTGTAPVRIFCVSSSGITKPTLTLCG
eukprot:3936462-Rhodomonas_salina.1